MSDHSCVSETMSYLNTPMRQLTHTEIDKEKIG